MDNTVCSRTLAELIANILGHSTTKCSPNSFNSILHEEGDRILSEIAETYRYLPAEPINWTIDLARFLNAQSVDATTGLRPDGWPLHKLREIRDYALFLRGRYGRKHPADENDAWTEEDERDLTAENLRVWDEREARGDA